MARSGALGTLFRYELKMLLRDRRTVFFSVILPLLLLPAMIFIIRFVEGRAEERREDRVYEYAVVGDHPDLARSLLEEALGSTGEQADGPETEDGLGPAGPFREVQPTNADSALAAGDLQFLVIAYSAEEARALRDSALAERLEAMSGELEGHAPGAEGVEGAMAASLEADRGPAVPLLRLRYRGNSEESGSAAAAMADRLNALREARRHVAYREAGLPVDPEAVAQVELRTASSPERESGAQLAIWLTPLLVMLMLSGGTIVAADAISGEKERGTLETLLTTSVRRREIVMAKQLLIIVVGLAITVINIANLGLYLGLGLFDLPDQFVISVPPLAVVVLLLLFLPLTVLISSALLMLSGYSKSYKEYQVYFFPVLLVFVLPTAAPAIPGIELTSVMALVPLANISLAVREVMIGEYDWFYLALVVLSTGLLAAWMAHLTERTLSTEKLITASELDEADLRGGAALFPRRVLRWFGVLWVVLFLSALWFGAELGVRGQVLFNVVGLFFGGALLMMWRYRLDPREALALRMPRPAVWIGVLLAAPSAFLVGIGLTQLSQQVIPVPERVIEAFGQFLLPEGVPLWQTVLLLAVAPAICEEIAFRGVLLHGLRRRFRPVPLALVLGGIFGLFHMDLFRLIPTAYLGTLLAAVTLATGSIFPAMLWHGLNNAVALVPAELGWWSPDAAVPLWLYGAALIALIAGLALIWTHRTPYPGLRGSREKRPGDAAAGVETEESAVPAGGTGSRR